MGFDEVSEPLYAGEQIHIPPELPEVLKQFTKAAIKTQPDNTYLWAAQYFEALAGGKQPPVKSRLVLQRTHVTEGAEGEEAEGYDDDDSEGYDDLEDDYDDVTIDKLDELAEKLRGGPGEVAESTIVDVCGAVGFPQLIVEDVFNVGKFSSDRCNWAHFVTLACASLPDTGDLLGSMKVAVGVLGDDGAMSLSAFSESYGVLADLDPHITEEEKAAGLADFVKFAEANDGKVTAAAFGDVEEADAAGAAVAEEEGVFDRLLEGLAGGAAEVPLADMKSACADSGIASELVEVVMRIGKFGDTVPWANFAALLIANDATTIEDMADRLIAALGAVGVPLDTIKAAHAFISKLDSSQTDELIEARASKMTLP